MKLSSVKQKRRLIFLLCCFLLIGIFFFFFLRKKDYSLTYKIESYQIKEEYVKEKNYYSLEIFDGKNTFLATVLHPNFFAKKLIYQIDSFTVGDETCLEIYSNKVRFQPLCHNQKEQISVHLTSDEMKEHFSIMQTDEVKDSYGKIDSYLPIKQDIYIWNYRGFYHWNSNKKEEISLFTKDVYDAKLLAQTNDILFVPDYEQNYYFEKVYLIRDGKVNEWKLKEPIYFDSVILGVYEDDIYLVDKHQKVEWKLNVAKKSMEVVGSEQKIGITYQNGWKEVSMNKLMYQDYTFSQVHPISYENQNGVYQVHPKGNVLIRNESVSSIALTLEDAVYYFVGDTLYRYQDTTGEEKFLTYFEWNFNSEHTFFLF